MNKYITYFMVLENYYSVEKEKIAHLSFKKFLSFEFLLLTNREKIKTLEFDFINMDKNHLITWKQILEATKLKIEMNNLDD